MDMTEKQQIGYAKYRKTMEVCLICQHPVYNMEKHLQTEEHKRSQRRLREEAKLDGLKKKV